MKILLFTIFSLSFGSCFLNPSKKDSGSMKEKTIFVENYHSANINGFCKVILTDIVQGQIHIIAGENIIDKISVQSNYKDLDVSLSGLEDYDQKKQQYTYLLLI